MPDKDTRSPTRSSTAKASTGPVLEEEVITASNSEQIQEVQTSGGNTSAGSSTGLANYQSSLGTWLGGELYGAVSENLALSKLGSHADKAVKSALRSAASQIDRLDEYDNVYVQPGFSDAFGRALSHEMDGVASSWLQSDDGRRLAENLQNWTDANPYSVAAVGLLAAGGAIAADMDIPELKHTFDLNNEWSATVGADIGSFRNIALEEVKAKLEYHSGNLIMAIEGSKTADDARVGFGLKYTW